MTLRRGCAQVMEQTMTSSPNMKPNWLHFNSNPFREAGLVHPWGGAWIGREKISEVSSVTCRDAARRRRHQIDIKLIELLLIDVELHIGQPQVRRDLSASL